LQRQNIKSKTIITIYNKKSLNLLICDFSTPLKIKKILDILVEENQNHLSAHEKNKKLKVKLLLLHS